MRIFVLLASLLAISAGLAIANSTIAAEKGQEIYQKRCQVCHGPTGGADGPLGKNLKNMPDLTKKEVMSAKKDEELLKVVSEGKGVMPSMKNLLSQDEVKAVVEYVRTFAK